MPLTPAENVAQMHRLVFSVQQDADYSLLPSLLSPNFINHTAEAGLPADASGVELVMRYLHAAFEEIEMRIDSCVCEGDVVATNKVLRGKWVGDWLGVMGKGERVEVRIMDFVTVDEQGRILEHWACLRPVEVLGEGGK